MTRLAVGVVLIAPCLLAPKCIDYKEIETDTTGATAASSDDDDAGESGTALTAATPCPKPGEAQLTARDKRFDIECGCVESDGKTCTVAVGTRVTWAFRDSEEHNVASMADHFGESGDKLGGSFAYTFESSGNFVYSCSIHSKAMSGYAIEVK